MDKQNVEAQLTALGLNMLYEKFLVIRRTVNLVLFCGKMPRFIASLKN